MDSCSEVSPTAKTNKSEALVPFNVIRPTEPDFWTLPL